MHTFGIIGLGLIGGSLAAALKKSDPECRILAGNRTKTVLEKALEEGLIDEAVSGPEGEKQIEDKLEQSCAECASCGSRHPELREAELSEDEYIVDQCVADEHDRAHHHRDPHLLRCLERHFERLR